MDHSAGAAPGGPPDPVRAPSPRERLAAAAGGGARGGAAPSGQPGRAPLLPEAEGLQSVRPLGRSTWLVREERSGEEFVLRVCARDGAGPGLAPAVARAAAGDLAGRQTPHLVAVRALLGPAATPVGLVEDRLAGGSLAERLARRGPLRADEAAEVLRGAAAGLAALHALGWCHGRLTARQVLFRGEGTDGVALAGAAVPPGGGGGRPEDDVRALGVVAWTALTGRVPGPDGHRVPLALLCPAAPPELVGAVQAALAVEPADRPTAAALAAGAAGAAASPALGSGRAAPGRAVPGGVDTGARRPGRARRAGGRARAGARRWRGRLSVAAALVLAAAAAGTLLVPEEDGRSAPGSPPVPGSSATRPAGVPGAAGTGPAEDHDPGHRSAEDTRTGREADGAVADGAGEALRELVARRGRALRTGDARILEEVYAPGSATLAADRRTLERADRGGGDPFAGLVLEVAAVRPAGPAAPAAGVVEVVAEVRTHGYRGDPGAAPSVVPAGDDWVQTVDVVLVRTAQGWRLRDVAPAAAAGDPATQDPRR